MMKKEMTKEEELQQIGDTIIDRVLHYCNNITGDTVLTCLSAHDDLSLFVEDEWYLGHDNETREYVNEVLKDKENYDYVKEYYERQLQSIIKDIEKLQKDEEGEEDE